MKYLKMLGLAAIAAMALMAFVGAGTASATVLDNGAGTKLAAETPIDASLVGSAVLKETGANGNTLDTCTTGTVEGVTKNAGSATETVKGVVTTENLTWSNCISTTDTAGGGELEIHWIEGTSNGTVTGTTFSVTVSVFGVSCSYGLSTTDTMVHLGTLTGSDTTPVLSINTAVVKRAGGFLCPGSAVWQATYHVTTPTGLTVTGS